MARARTRRPLPDRLIGPEELAEFLGVSPHSVQSYAAMEGAPKARYLKPKRPLWLLSEWVRFFHSRPVAGASGPSAGLVDHLEA